MSVRNRRAVLVAAWIFAGGLGCGTTDPQPTLNIAVGLLTHGELGPPAVQAPTSASVGVSFVVQVLTEGNGCVSFSSTDVVTGDQTVEITPYDQVETPPHGTGCTQELALIAHNSSVQFASPGMNTIIVHGRTEAGSGYAPLDLSFQLSVQP